MISETLHAPVPWGWWDDHDQWHPNLYLAMSTEEQHRQNRENGFLSLRDIGAMTLRLEAA